MKHLIWLFSGIICYACLEPYDFESNNTDKLLIVEGGISDIPMAHAIRLSYSFHLDSSDSPSELNHASVLIESGSGVIETLNNIGDGIYVTGDDYFGEAGQQYRLLVSIGEANYESTFETLVGSPEIDRLYGEYVKLPNEETNEVEGGVQFYVDTHDDSGEVKYYRYEYEDTYKIDLIYASKYKIIDGDSIVERTPTEINSIRICYGDNSSSSLIIGTSINNGGNELLEFPLRYISESSELLRVRISMLTKQLAITESAYTYYKKLEENRNSTGSLFDIQLGSVTGNISNTDGDEPVLGYFEVAGMTERRDFFDREDFAMPPYSSCFLPSLLPLDSVISFYLPVLYPSSEIYDIVWDGDALSTTYDSAYLMGSRCTRCDLYDDNFPPDFWID